MQIRRSLVASLLLLPCLVAAGKEKKKVLLPTDVLQARTVLVVIDPDAGMDIENPDANRAAREDVERALRIWGRFSVVTDASEADLVISVRRGNGKIAQPTIGGPPINGRQGGMQQPGNSGGGLGNGNAGGFGGRTGLPQSPDDASGTGAASPYPQAEVGPAEDMFVLYRGRREKPLNSPAIWRYTARNALQPPDVPAIEELKALITETEKQQAAKP